MAEDRLSRAAIEAAVKQRLSQFGIDRIQTLRRLNASEAVRTIPLSVLVGEPSITEVAKAAVSEFIEECKRKGVGPSEVVFL